MTEYRIFSLYTIDFAWLLQALHFYLVWIFGLYAIWFFLFIASLTFLSTITILHHYGISTRSLLCNYVWTVLGPDHVTNVKPPALLVWSLVWLNNARVWVRFSSATSLERVHPASLPEPNLRQGLRASVRSFRPCVSDLISVTVVTPMVFHVILSDLLLCDSSPGMLL